MSLQKSNYEEKYYINFGVWLKKLGINEYPEEKVCHIRSRLASLFPDNANLFEHGCVIGTETENDVKNMVCFIKSNCIPFFTECLREEGLKKLTAVGRFNNALVMKVVKDALSISM